MTIMTVSAPPHRPVGACFWLVSLPAMAVTVSHDYFGSMRLSDGDHEMLDGKRGEAARIAIRLLIAAGQAVGAESLIDISRAHIDGCLYNGLAGLDFASMMAQRDGEVVVPTTLNVSSIDLLHPQLYRGDADTADRARALMAAYEAMGCRPTWTCAPYQLMDRPALGEQVAWGESNAVAFANSVLGARTNRYGDFLDICCALTGRAPNVGLHTDEGRRATLLVDVALPDTWLDNDLIYVALGHWLGKEAGSGVAVLTGLDRRADEDRLKALGAAAASSGAVGLFHVLGVTPEAGTLGDVLVSESHARVLSFGRGEVHGAISELGSSADRLGAISVGTPHASLAELETLATICRGRTTVVPFYVSTGRDMLAAAAELGFVRIIEEFGATFVTDTCTYLTPILGAPDGAVMTNSGKWAYYAPSNIGVDVVIGTLRDCVESSATGTFVMGDLS
jgi:predicted aconitase